MPVTLAGADQKPLNGYHAFFGPDGKPVTDAPGIARIMASPDWREVEVELSEDSLCLRCQHLAKREGVGA